LQSLSITPTELLAGELAPTTAQRLASYGVARNLYLAQGRDVRPTSDLQAMLAQVREPLLRVLRVSPEFAPAYDPLLGMAMALSREQPAQAKALLSELAAAAPTRTEATAALARMTP
jgi:spermidine synthase